MLFHRLLKFHILLLRKLEMQQPVRLSRRGCGDPGIMSEN